MRFFFKKRRKHWHTSGVGGSPAVGVYGFCPGCGLRSPYYPWFNGAWGLDLLGRAIEEGTAYYYVFHENAHIQSS